MPILDKQSYFVMHRFLMSVEVFWIGESLVTRVTFEINAFVNIFDVISQEVSFLVTGIANITFMLISHLANIQECYLFSRILLFFKKAKRQKLALGSFDSVILRVGLPAPRPPPPPPPPGGGPSFRSETITYPKHHFSHPKRFWP